MKMKINGPEIPGRQKNLIVCLHGWGSSGDNFIHLAKMMSKFLPDSHFIAPNAPFIRKIGDGYEWFSLEDRSEKALYRGITNAASIVSNFIDEKLYELNLQNAQLSLVGFSQGAMLAIYVALTRRQLCSSVIAYSGRFIAPSYIESEIKSKPDVCLIHGEYDDVVPFSCLDESANALRNNGINVKSHAISSLGHIVNDEGIRLGAEFIKKHLGQ